METSVKLIVKTSDQENSYIIKAPNAGQLIDIENLKITLSPMYRELAKKGMILSDLALDIIDMQAYFSVLCPQLLKDVKVSLDELALPDLLQLRDAYHKQFLPWWNKWIKVIGDLPEDMQEEEVKEEVQQIQQEVEQIEKKAPEKSTKDQQQLTPEADENRVDPNKEGAEDVKIDLG